MTTREQMIQEIRGLNKHLTVEHLKELTNVELLRNVHPIDRVMHARRLHYAGELSDEDLRLFTAKS